MNWIILVNKVINELFNRAGGWTEVCDVSGEEILTYNEHLDPEKFAKLIVQECLDIADEYDGVGSTIVSRIEKHFGVEE
jgi:hypothetical protein